MHLHGDRRAIPQFVRIVPVENEQSIDGRRRSRQIVLREVRGLQVGQLAGQDLLRGERTKVMLAQPHAAAIHRVQKFL